MKNERTDDPDILYGLPTIIEKSDTIGFHIPDMDRAFHHQIKLAALQEGKSLKSWAIDALREKLERGAE